MCDVTMALTVGATVATAAGVLYNANANAAADKYNQQIAQMNAQLSERRAKDALEIGREEEQQKRLQVAQVQGKQIAALAAGNVDLGYGSPLDTIVDTATLGELDALTIRRNAANNAYDYKVQAANGQAQATLDGMSADSALAGGYIDAAGTILGGASSAYKDYKSSRITVPYNSAYGVP